jgi:hypothetical protein
MAAVVPAHASFCPAPPGGTPLLRGLPALRRGKEAMMYWMSLIVSLAFLPGGNANPAGEVPGDQLVHPFEEELVLVAGEVIDVGEHQVEVGEEQNPVAKSAPATIKVVHVFKGPKDVLGKLFWDSSTDGASRFANVARPAFSLGEKGLWTLRGIPDGWTLGLEGEKPKLVKQAAELRIQVYTRLHLGFYRRAREKHTLRFDQVRAVAEAVERFERTPSEERWGVILECASSETPEVSEWAIHKMARAKAEAVDRCLDRLRLDPKLTIGGQVALDEVLCGRREGAWISSPARLKWLDRWFQTGLKEHEASRVFEWLASARQRHKGAEDQALVKAIMPYVHNRDASVASRRRAIFLAGQTSTGGRDGGLAFLLLADRALNADEQELRIAAAHSLCYHVPLDQDRVDRIRALLPKAKDQETADLLRLALKRSGLNAGDPKPMPRKKRE